MVRDALAIAEMLRQSRITILDPRINKKADFPRDLQTKIVNALPSWQTRYHKS